jgi:hypothetical protein
MLPVRKPAANLEPFNAVSRYPCSALVIAKMWQGDEGTNINDEDASIS